MAYLEKQERNSTKDDYYLAQIALEVRRVLAKHPEKFQIDDFILKYKEEARRKRVMRRKKKLEAKDRRERKKELERHTLSSKAFWFALTGFKGNPEQ